MCIYIYYVYAQTTISALQPRNEGRKLLDIYFIHRTAPLYRSVLHCWVFGSHPLRIAPADPQKALGLGADMGRLPPAIFELQVGLLLWDPGRIDPRREPLVSVAAVCVCVVRPKCVKSAPWADADKCSCLQGRFHNGFKLYEMQWVRVIGGAALCLSLSLSASLCLWFSSLSHSVSLSLSLSLSLFLPLPRSLQTLSL